MKQIIKWIKMFIICLMKYFSFNFFINFPGINFVYAVFTDWIFSCIFIEFFFPYVQRRQVNFIQNILIELICTPTSFWTYFSSIKMEEGKSFKNLSFFIFAESTYDYFNWKPTFLTSSVLSPLLIKWIYLEFIYLGIF